MQATAETFAPDCRWLFFSHPNRSTHRRNVGTSETKSLPRMPSSGVRHPSSPDARMAFARDVLLVRSHTRNARGSFTLALPHRPLIMRHLRRPARLSSQHFHSFAQSVRCCESSCTATLTTNHEHLRHGCATPKIDHLVTLASTSFYGVAVTVNSAVSGMLFENPTIRWYSNALMWLVAHSAPSKLSDGRCLKESMQQRPTLPLQGHNAWYTCWIRSHFKVVVCIKLGAARDGEDIITVLVRLSSTWRVQLLYR